MNKLSFFTSCLLLLISIFTVHFLLVRPSVIVVEKGLDRLPLHFEEYSGKDVKMAGNVVSELDTDVYVFRNFNHKNLDILFYIGYYGTAKGGRTGHNPNVCYPSSGFAILDEKKVTIPVLFSNAKVSGEVVTRLLVKKNDEQQLVYHWYQSAGNDILAGGIKMNMHRFKTLLLKNRNDGAFVRISAEVNESLPKTESALLAFAKKIIPMIEHYWPIEKDQTDEPKLFSSE